MREGEALGLQLEVAEEEDVEVEGARAVAGAGEEPTLLHLDRLAEVEQGLGVEVGADADGGVEEIGLVEHLADRLGFIGGGDGVDLDAVVGERGERGTQVSLAIADVRAESEVSAGQRHSHASSASSSSSSSRRSWVTSTPTSWIESGSGGSGFAARTRTESQP